MEGSTKTKGIDAETLTAGLNDKKHPTLQESAKPETLTNFVNRIK